MNILDNAINHISSLIKNQQITINTYTIVNVYGMAQEVEESSNILYSHIQPITPIEMKKYTDSTIDSNALYKFFFSNDNAKIIHSFNLALKQSYIIWKDRKFKVYSLRDWYLQNGWAVAYGALLGNEDDR